MPITEAQRQIRRKYLGSSDTPVIMNLSPFKKTENDIYWSKVAELPEDDAPDYMQVGNWLEGPIIEWAADELGVEITREPKDLFHVEPMVGILAANHDSMIH
jgi:predicted phage-related endonuclease